MFERAELKKRGKAAFKNNYWLTVIVAFVLSALVSNFISADVKTVVTDMYTDTIYVITVFGYTVKEVSASVANVVIIIELLLGVFVFNVVAVGGNLFFLKNSEYPNDNIGDLIFGFSKEHYLNIVIVEVIKNVKIFLWTLLFIIPGIIKTYEYYMVPYILAENPQMKYKDVLALSKKMTDGVKMDIFVFELSFILWALLSIVTFGIAGIFYVDPYIKATHAELYKELKSKTVLPTQEKNIFEENNVIDEIVLENAEK